MKRSDKDQKTAIEGWIDERIQFVLAGLTHPFERKVAQLQMRIQALQDRIRRISDRMGGQGDHDHETGERSGQETSRE